MQRYPVSLLKKIKQHIKNGGVIAYPTESCYGFGCDPFNYKAINKIIQIKGRNKTKGLIVISSKISQLNRLILPLSSQDIKNIKKYWPGFYTIILPAAHSIPSNLTGKHHKIAVRVSKHTLVQQICNYLNMPLVSTSANYSGFNSVKTYRECIRHFGDKVMVLPGTTNFATHPSTIIDWATGKKLR